MEFLSQNSQLMQYLFLFLITILLKISKTPKGVELANYFLVGFEFTIACFGVLIILVDQYKSNIPTFLLGYVTIIVILFIIDARGTLSIRATAHATIALLVAIFTWYSFAYWIKPYQTQSERGIYRVSIPYIDNTLIQHIGDKRSATLNPSVFTLDINASSVEDARMKALKIFNDPAQEPRPFKTTAPKNAINLIKLDDKITAELLVKK